MTLKRFCLLFLTIFSMTLVYGQDTFRDNFSSVSYSNNNGSLNFSTNWIESNDNNNAGSGRIQINGNRLRFEDISSNDHQIRRSANLTGAAIATLSFNWQTSGLDFNENLAVQISTNGTNYTTLDTFGGSQTGNFNEDITAYISANTTIRFIGSGFSWESNEFTFIDNFEIAIQYVIPPALSITDVTVNEDGGSAVFTVEHLNSDASGAYSINFQTVNGSATAGSDYTYTTGTLNFNGNEGDTETITVSILDDGAIENLENFSIEFTSTTDGSVDISDTGIGTIRDNDAIIMTDGETSNECNIVFLDPGGLSDYSNNLDVVQTICPDGSNDYVVVDFTSFDVVNFDLLYVYDGDTTSATLLGQYDNNNPPSKFSSTHASGCLTFRFTSSGFNTAAGWEADVRCYPDGPEIIITDISFDEDVGNAVFTVTSTRAPHGRNVFLVGFVETDFTVDYQTVDGTALAGSDYTATSGTLTFNGEVGNIQTISVPIANDGIPEVDESFTIEFTGANAPDAPVNIEDTGTGTINTQILANDPLTLFQSFDGKYDYSVTGGSLRTQSNGDDPCTIQSSSSNQLISAIPPTGNVEAAYLYWAHSNTTRDDQVTFEGQTVDAGYVYQTTLTNRNFYGYVSDVTSIVQGIPNLSTNVFDFTDLDIDTADPYCSSATVLGGWSLIVFYEEPTLPAVNINLYQGFDGLSNEGTSFTLDSFFAIAGSGAKATFLSWEGDPDLDGNHPSSTNPEALSITNQSNITNSLTGDGGQTGNNAYNSTIYDNTVAPVYNDPNAYGVDLDTYDISSYIAPGDTQVTANVDMGQDFVINMAVVLKVPSNLIAGTVFEDVNYPGGNGRDQVASAGIGVSGATVELFDSSGNFVERKNTDSNGNYSFGGMEDGTFSVKVVNSTVRSNRNINCSACYPVQTYRNYGDANTLTDVTTEVGGADPAATQDVALGVLTGAQSVSQVTVASNGVAGVDFGFNFNTIVNTNEVGQGSLEQFIINSNNLGETGLDIEANGIFDPAAGEDTSIFMIPTTGDPLGRTADANFSGGYFDIFLSNGNPLPIISADNTVIDGRTQTAYSGDTNLGTVGAGGGSVGVSGNTLPDYDLPEIQIHSNSGDVLRVDASSTIRNVSVYANNNAAIQVTNGSATILQNLLAVDANGTNAGDVVFGVEIIGGDLIIDGNYIATATGAGILVDGGNSISIQNNHITSNGNTACDDNITLISGAGITIQQNLIENAASMGIDGDDGIGNIVITENTVIDSGQDGGNCSGNLENAGILLDGNNSLITRNVIASNGGAGIVLAGGNTSGNLISQNSIYANGTSGSSLGIDIDTSDGVGDGVTINDSGDSDNGPNGAINFPVISGIYLAGGNIVVEGWSRPGATIELFLTDVDQGSAVTGDNTLGLSTDYGEGQSYIGAIVEGSVDDLDSRIDSYTDFDGNTDNTNRYKIRFPVPPGAAVGSLVTATATIANSTSEFSPQSIIQAYTVITNRRITYRVKRN